MGARLILLSLLAAVGCTRAVHSDARARYNRAVDSLEQGNLEAAKEGFLDARGEAGADQSLRSRAAFNLGVTHALSAEKVAESDPEAALTELRASASWFGDAIRLSHDDADARANLQIVQDRARALADQLNRGQNGLEARLDRLIEEQRAVLAAVRQLMTALSQAGASSEPAAFRKEFDQLAARERTLLADAGTVADLAGDERAGLQDKPEESLTDEERVRLVQLMLLTDHIHQARVAQEETRSTLQRLLAGESHRRASAAVTSLVRAREQLLGPVAALNAVVQEQLLLTRHTAASLERSSAPVNLDDPQGDKTAGAPPWLAAPHLAQRQKGLRERSAEVLERLQAATSAAASDLDQAADAGVAPSASPDPAASEQDAAQARMLARAKGGSPPRAGCGAGDGCGKRRARRGAPGAWSRFAVPGIGRPVSSHRVLRGHERAHRAHPLRTAAAQGSARPHGGCHGWHGYS